jgi:hypothetical protein
MPTRSQAAGLVPLAEIAAFVAKPRQRTAMSPFLMGDRVHSAATIAHSEFDGEIIGVRGEFFLVADGTGMGYRRLAKELRLIER